MPVERPWLLVEDPEYFRAVLKNLVMRFHNALHDENVVVRFGLGGEGIRPNYQLEGPPGKVFPIASVNHEIDAGAPDGHYDDAMLSVERLSLVQVRDLLERSRKGDALPKLQKLPIK